MPLLETEVIDEVRKALSEVQGGEVARTVIPVLERTKLHLATCTTVGRVVPSTYLTLDVAALLNVLYEVSDAQPPRK